MKTAIVMCLIAHTVGQPNTNDPHYRRAMREKAVAQVGQAARPFVESFGDDAVAALFGCSPTVGCKLSEFYSAGGFTKLARPNDLLRVIAQPRHGDSVALFVIQRVADLEDPDALDALIATPLEYALGLKPLSQGAQDVRARRLSFQATNAQSDQIRIKIGEQEKIALVVCVVVFVGFLFWKFRRQSP